MGALTHRPAGHMERIHSNSMNNTIKQRVAIIGASNKPDRYAYLVLQDLAAHGHDVVLINPALSEIEDRPVLPDLSSVAGEIDTVTLYLGPARSTAITDDLIAKKPGRVIFNPGTESPALEKSLDDAGIPWIKACTLVLLRTGQF